MTSLGPYQTTLFGLGAPAVATDAVVHRTLLDEHSWVDVGRGWLSGADDLLADLAKLLPWRRGRRPMYGTLVDDPRLSAACDRDDPSIHPVVADMAAWIDDRYDEAIDSVWVNYYRDGRDSVAWHSDRVGRSRVNPIVAVVSLGGPRRFLMRPRGGGSAMRYTLWSGDLLVMGGACQHGWEHTIPKVAAAPPRMSVTLRRRHGFPLPRRVTPPSLGETRSG